MLVHTEGEGLVLWRVGAHVFRRYGCGCVKGEGKWQIEVGFTPLFLKCLPFKDSSINKLI